MHSGICPIILPLSLPNFYKRLLFFSSTIKPFYPSILSSIVLILLNNLLIICMDKNIKILYLSAFIHYNFTYKYNYINNRSKHLSHHIKFQVQFALWSILIYVPLFIPYFRYLLYFFRRVKSKVWIEGKNSFSTFFLSKKFIYESKVCSIIQTLLLT